MSVLGPAQRHGGRRYVRDSTTFGGVSCSTSVAVPLELSRLRLRESLLPSLAEIWVLCWRFMNIRASSTVQLRNFLLEPSNPVLVRHQIAVGREPHQNFSPTKQIRPSLLQAQATLQSSHSSQGQTAQRVLIHVDTAKSEFLVNNRFAYVSVSSTHIDAFRMVVFVQPDLGQGKAGGEAEGGQRQR